MQPAEHAAGCGLPGVRAHLHAAPARHFVQRRAAPLILEQRVHQPDDERDLMRCRRGAERGPTLTGLGSVA